MARVLFVCPTYPLPGRIGLAMRAGVSLEGLAAEHEVSVAVVRWADDDHAALDWAAARAERAILVPHASDRRSASTWMRTARGRSVLGRALPDLVMRVPPAVGDEIARQLGSEFDVVVVMRTYLVGAVVPLLDAGVPAILDADDDEAHAQRSLATIGAGDVDEADRYEAFQQTVFPWFAEVLFAAREGAGDPCRHLPNAVRLPAAPRTRPHDGGPLELVYVGDVGHPPNRDAVDRLTQRILPALARTGVDARLLRPGPRDDVGAFYERAHIAVVPLRAGGGTSIKVLEAFAHGCPVVATPTGARGLGVRDGEELVVTGDDEDDLAFAEALAELGRDDERRVRLAANARRFVAAHHDAAVVGAQLSELAATVARTRKSGPASSRGRS